MISTVALGFLLLTLLVLGIVFVFVTMAAGGVFLALVGNHVVLNRLNAQRANHPDPGLPHIDKATT